MPHLNRTVHVGNSEWKYRIGKTYVVIQEPNSDKKHTVHFKDLAPTKYKEAFKNYCCKDCNGTPDFSITPEDVKIYIEAVIIENAMWERGG